MIDWLIDSGVHGLVMAANASEGHAQSDAEKDQIVEFGLKRVAGRVPVVVTVTHFAVEVAREKARRAEAMGAACVMSMPQFFGNWGSDLPATQAYYNALAGAVKIPVMVQDHPVSGVAMNAEFLARLAAEIGNVSYFKLEFTQVYGLERHSPYRHGGVGYPSRAVRTSRHLYIRNYFPDRWPAGDPPHFADPSSDSSPKQWILANRDNSKGRRLFELCYAKRPSEELYDLESDAAQLVNVADRTEYGPTLRQLRQALVDFQTRWSDPRAQAGPTDWEDSPAPHTPFLFPEFMPADNDERLERLKERYFAAGGSRAKPESKNHAAPSSKKTTPGR